MRFKVTDNATGKSKTYKLTDFTYDEDSEKYTLELEKKPGGYKVTESVFNVKGYTTESVTYQVGNNKAKEGAAVKVKVESGKSVKVAFKDKYSKTAVNTDSTSKTQTSTASSRDGKDSDQKGKSRTPKTGDETPLMLYYALLLLGALGIGSGFTALFRKKKH